MLLMAFLLSVLTRTERIDGEISGEITL